MCLLIIGNLEVFLAILAGLIALGFAFSLGRLIYLGIRNPTEAAGPSGPQKCPHCGNSNYHDVVQARDGGVASELGRVCDTCQTEFGFWGYGHWEHDGGTESDPPPVKPPEVPVPRGPLGGSNDI